MKCSAENCKNFEENWCESMEIGDKSCFEPVSPGQNASNSAPEAVLSAPEVFQGGEIPHTAPETLKTAKSAKTAEVIGKGWKMIIPIRALSVNKCWQGRRFKTKEYNQYCKDVALLLMSQKGIFLNIENKPCEIILVFWFKNWQRRDIDNSVKPLLDILVANKVIPDDRYIMKMSIEKRVAKTAQDEAIGFEWRYI